MLRCLHRTLQNYRSTSRPPLLVSYFHLNSKLFTQISDTSFIRIASIRGFWSIGRAPCAKWIYSSITGSSSLAAKRAFFRSKTIDRNLLKLMISTLWYGLLQWFCFINLIGFQGARGVGQVRSEPVSRVGTPTLQVHGQFYTLQPARPEDCCIICPSQSLPQARSSARPSVHTPRPASCQPDFDGTKLLLDGEVCHSKL